MGRCLAIAIAVGLALASPLQVLAEQADEDEADEPDETELEPDDDISPEQAVEEMAPLIVRVRVEGIARVSEADVLATARSAAGRRLSRRQLREDVLALYELGFFEDVQVDVDELEDGVEVVFRLTERPVVHEVRIEGNHAVNDEDLEEVVDIHENAILQVPAVRRVQDRIIELYAERGFFLAEVDYEIVPATSSSASDSEERRVRRAEPSGRASRPAAEREEPEPSAGAEVDVVFHITERDRVAIRRITFVGNEALSDDDLRASIQTKEGGFFSFLTKSGTFRREMLEQDLMLVQARYYDEGYLNVHVGTPRVALTSDRRFLDLSIPVEEGTRFKIGRVRVREVDREGRTAKILGGRRVVREMIHVRRGEWFSRSKVAADLERIQRHYRDSGYANVNIEPRTAVDLDERVVDLNFEIERGPLVHIERINIRGNEKTTDRVIRRELLIAEGELYSESKIQASKRRVEALGYFERVELSTRRGSEDDQMEINIEVAERSTGTFQVGAGFSSQENFIATAQVSQQNIFGRGQTLSLQGQISSLRQLFMLQFVEPYLADTSWILSLDLFNMVRAYEDFNRTSTGGSLGFGYPVLPDLRLYLTYTGEYVDVSTQSAGTLFGPSPSFRGVLRNLPLANLFEDGFTSSVRASITYDSRNNRIFPTSGTYDSLSVEVSSPYIGSQNPFVRWRAYSRWYFPIVWGIVFRVNLEAGLIYDPDEGQVPIYERFFEGGIYSVRGYTLRSLGPRIYSVPRSLDPNETPISGGVNIGGNLSLVANLEIEFPIIPQVNIRGVVFFDAGNAFNLEEVWCTHTSGSATNPFADACVMDEPWMLRTSVGFGFRWFSPLGPLRFEWGIPIINVFEGEEPIDFQFTIGNVF